MTIVNHLQGLDAQRIYHAVAYGKHLVTGNLAKSSVAGSDPTHVITLQQMLGRGEWNACKGLWFKGLEVKSDKYIFHPGTFSSGMSDPVQGQSAVFDTDVPHSLLAWIEAELATGVGDFDTKTSPPVGLSGIFETMVIDDHDSDGDVTDNSYSASPARETADLIIRLGNRPGSRIDWSAWCDWRDFLGENIAHDYTALTDFDGIGLLTSLYNGTAFDTFVSKRVDPVIEFVTSSGSPGVGVDVDNFSVRFEGKIKALFTETYTFYIGHTHGAKVWVDDLGTPLIDQWSSTGTHSATIALTAGQLYDIKIEWKHTTGNADLKFEWQSTSQTREVINHRCLYPKSEDRPRYETHPFFSAPTRLDDAVKTILSLCNSVVQEVNGKLRFFCLEQLGTDDRYHFDNDAVKDGSLTLKPRDLRTMRNSWKAHLRDVDSQYLEEPIDPVLIERPDLIELAGRTIDGEAIELFNCNIHQGYRTLDNIVRRNVDSKWQPITFTGMPETFPVLAGDRTLLDVEFRDLTNIDTLVLESNDSPSESTADERTFTVQEWPDFTVYDAV
ncbi:MAG TPA: PA14 domain-containing protein [Pyrinomonadaceae bacterium]|jgi:hypothetical protein|nr:PA14 domain-containing protein [Pyrinomonadaceae bacterium]